MKLTMHELISFYAAFWNCIQVYVFYINNTKFIQQVHSRYPQEVNNCLFGMSEDVDSRSSAYQRLLFAFKVHWV